MKNFKVRRPNYYVRVFLLSTCLASVLLEINAVPRPQWVWNKDAIDNNRQANYQQGFVGQSSNYPVSPSKESQSVRVEGQSRRFLPGLISSITNGGGGGGGGSSSGSGAAGALGGIFGSVLQTIPQFATSAIGGITGIFGNRPITLPAKNPDSDSSGGNSGVSVPVTGGSGSCKCVSQNECFLPAKPTGSCDGGKVQCCSTSRTIFPDDDTKGSTKNERTVTQREIRRGLLQHILKGSGNVVDDTLDLILAPFLSTEDQQKLATRVTSDDN